MISSCLEVLVLDCYTIGRRKFGIMSVQKWDIQWPWIRKLISMSKGGVMLTRNSNRLVSLLAFFWLSLRILMGNDFLCPFVEFKNVPWEDITNYYNFGSVLHCNILTEEVWSSCWIYCVHSWFQERPRCEA